LKKYHLSVLLVVLSLFLFAGCSAADNIDSQKTSASSSSKEPQVHRVGEPVRIKDLSYTVEKFEEAKEYNGHKTDGKFVIVEIEADNLGKEAVSVTNDMFVLVDDKNRQYKSDPMRDISFQDKKYFAITEQINPGLKKIGRVSFEVPNDVDRYALAMRADAVDLGGAEYQFVKLKN
jgi:hypothetical protein